MMENTIVENRCSARRNSDGFLLLLLGLLSGLGPFVTDFYLPALPMLGESFSTTAALVQLSLTCTMIGLAVGQLLFGPFSDKYGRRVPLLCSLVLLVAATVACVVAQDINTFVAARLVQGFTGAGGVVISRSVVTDLFQGKAMSRFFVLLAMVQGMAPVAAPVLGGLCLKFTDWRGIFVILLALSALLLAASCFFRESHPADRRLKGSIAATFAHYAPVLRNAAFMKFVLVQAFALSVMFSYIAASPFIFQNIYGVSPTGYSLCFGLNAAGILLGGAFVPRFSRESRAMWAGTAGMLVVSLCVSVALVTSMSIVVVEGLFFLMLFFLGFVLPTSTALALDIERDNSGYASAVLGFSTFLFGGVASPLTGTGDILWSTSLLMVLCSLCAAILSWTVRHTAISFR